MASMTDYLNKLVTQKNTLADNLVTMGIEATHDESLETLVPKVLDINSGGTPSAITFNGTYSTGDILEIEIIALNNTTQHSIEILLNNVVVQTENIEDIVFFDHKSISITTTVELIGEITVRASDTGIGIVGVWIPYIMTPMTDDTTETSDGNLIVSASSIYELTPQSKAYKAFDGVVGDEYEVWHPDYGTPQWLSIEFPIPICIKDFTMYNRQSYLHCPQNVIFQCSNDGENWTDNSSFIFSNSGGKGLSKHITTDNNIFYKYYRWYITSANEHYAVISEITFDKIYKSIYSNDNIQICSKNN